MKKCLKFENAPSGKLQRLPSVCFIRRSKTETDNRSGNAFGKPIIVLDEPTSGLDWDNMCAVANAVNYMREAGKLVFIITHDLEFISLTASRALLLKEGIIKDDLQMTEQNNFKIVKNFMVEEGGE